MSVPSRPNIYAQPLTEYSQATFWWDPPTSGGPITSYILCNASPPLSYTFFPTTGSAWIRDLTPNTTYSFQVAASNAIGLGPFASYATITTGVEPFPVQNISANPASNTSNTMISWDSNPSNTDVQYHILTATPYNNLSNEIPSSTITKSVFGNQTNFLLQNLGPYSYSVALQAGNSCGYSPAISTIVNNL